MERSYDAIVIGGGLSGLTAALNLQLNGLRTVLFEKSERFGGLCGVTRLDGYEFPVAANDFGLGLRRVLRSLNVDLEFEKVQSRYHFSGGLVVYPPDLGTCLRLLGQPGDVLRGAAALLRRRRRPAGVTRLDELSEALRSPLLRDFLASLGYFTGAPPDHLTLEGLADVFNKEHAYGYEQYIVPARGPGFLVESLVSAFRAAGGQAAPGAPCQVVAPRGGRKRVSTPDADYTARYVVSSEGRWHEYPPDSRPGLANAMLLLAVDRRLPYPRGVHTIAWFPADVKHWLTQLHEGSLPQELGFHLFKSDLEPGREHYTISIYYYTPRAADTATRSETSTVERHLLDRAETLLPGLRAAIRYQRSLLPEEFERRYGFPSRPSFLVPPLAFRKPGNYDAERDIYYVGNSVTPPGEHAGQAVLSGLVASRKVLETHERRSSGASGA